MARRRKTIGLSDMTAAERRTLASWLSERIAEMEPEEREIAAESGPEFMPALRGLRDFLARDFGDNS